MKNITKPSLLVLRLPLPPLSLQQTIMKQVEAGRAEIAKLKADAAKADVEAVILGTKPVR